MSSMKADKYLAFSQDILDYVKETKVKSVVLIILFLFLLLLSLPSDHQTTPELSRSKSWR